MRKFILPITITSLLIGSVSPMSPRLITLHNETLEIETQSDNTEQGYTGGYIPNDLDNNTPVYENDIALYSDIPSSYNTVADIQNRYPDVRNQNPYGTCWAFSSIGLAEFDLINDGAADRNIDLSELQLAYYTFNSVTDPLGGTEGDYAKYYNENTSTNYLNYGGNYSMAARRFAQWVGAVNESDVPYNTQNINNVLTNGLDDSYAYNADVAHLQNAYLINIKQNPTDVKQQIIEHSAVGISYYHRDLSLCWNESRNEYTYYDTDKTGGGHAVMVVGWDDNYSKDNFVGDKPSSDGAWLIRNSWGFYCSYFWMSYETCSLDDTAWVFDFSLGNEFDNNYQLDGGLQVYPNSQYKTMANVFTAKTDSNVKSETLKAVSVSFTKYASVSYTIDIYTDLTDTKNPLSGTKQDSATTQGTTAYAGIYTIELADEVEIQPGSSFAVVISVDKYALDYEQATTIANGDNLENIIWDCAVSSYNEKTFFKSGNKFYTYPWGNLCVKAFTTDNVNDSKPDTPNTPSYIVDGLDYSAVFDANYYYENHPDIANAYGKNSSLLFEHFIKYGIYEGRQACTTFNPTSYKNNYPDLAEAYKDDTAIYYKHYILFGLVEGRSGLPLNSSDESINYIVNGIDYSIVFNADYYYDYNPDIANEYGKNASLLFEHFIKYGIYEGRIASSEFNIDVYKSNYPDLVAAYATDNNMYYEHFIKYGKNEGRNATTLLSPIQETYIWDGVDYSHVFEPEFYFNNHPDVAASYGYDKAALFNHFISYGIHEGRQAHADFNVNIYRNRYQDLNTAFGDDLKLYYLHYIQYGYNEGRTAY